MERVPYEIRLQIFESISYPDKLACTFVCKDWNRLIKPYLFKKITTRNSRNLTSAITFFENYPEIAIHILHFEIKTCSNALMYVSQIQELFPKLNKLKLSTELECLRCPLKKLNCISSIWSNLKELKISEILNVNNATMAELVLPSQCPNLTKLSLDIIFETYDDLLKNRFTRIVNLLQNAPRLSHLEFSSTVCSLPDIDALHQSATKLDSLRLSGIELDTSYRPAGPLETVQLNDLHVQFCSTPNDIVSVFDYFVKKYTGLTSFSITVDNGNNSFNNFPTSELESALIPLFAHCPKLKYYDQMFIPLTPTILTEMDQCGIQLNGITLYVDQNTVERQCQILNNSSQCQSINHVSLYLQDVDPEDDEDLFGALNVKQAIDSLDGLNNLSDLTIISNSNQVCLSEVIEFLNKVPKLSKFSMNEAHIQTDPEDVVSVDNMLLLKTLEIRNLDLEWEDHPAVNKIFKKFLPHCPELEAFVLDIFHDDIRMGYTESVILDFRQNPNLKSIIVDIHRYSNQIFIMRSTPASSGYYVYDKKKKVLEERVSFEPGEYYTTIILSQPVLLNSCQV